MAWCVGIGNHLLISELQEHLTQPYRHQMPQLHFALVSILQVPDCSKIFRVCVPFACSVSFRCPLHCCRSARPPRALLTLGPCATSDHAATAQSPGRARMCSSRNTSPQSWLLLAGGANHSNPRPLLET